MTCQQVQMNLSLYLYGELEFAQEEAIERHLEICALCHSATERERSWHSSVQAEQQGLSFELLSECRRDLRVTLDRESRGGVKASWFKRLLPGQFSGTRWSTQLAAASFLVFAGFTAARLMDRGYLPTIAERGPVTGMSLLDAPNAHVRDIQPSGENGVRIIVDRVQRQEVIGRLDDDVVRRLLLNAMRDPSDPGIRVNSVEALENERGSDVRDALLNTVPA